MSFEKNLPEGWVKQAGVPMLETDYQELTQIAHDLSKMVAVEATSYGMASGWDVEFSQALLSWAAAPLNAGPVVERASKQAPQSVLAVQAALEAIDGGVLSELAWINLDREAALAIADRQDKGEVSAEGAPLLGVPMGMKDMFDRKGHVARWGAKLCDDAKPALADSTVYARLVQAGAINLGQLHMAECALSPIGMNAHLGPGRNPHDVQRVSGGSSSGCGMVVGAGQVPLAIGSDTGGSIRVPAAYCGTYGLKPTQYRVSAAGAMPLSPSLDCLGPLANSLELTATVFNVIAGQDERDPMCLRMPAPQDDWSNVSGHALTLLVPELPDDAPVSESVREVLALTVEQLKAAGVVCVPGKLPNMELLGKLGTVVLSAEASALHRGQLIEKAGLYGPQVRRRVSLGYLLGATDYADAIRLRSRYLSAFMRETLAGADAMLLPATPDVAPLVSETVSGPSLVQDKIVSQTAYWCRPINYLGVPALVVPAGRTAQNLPLGVQLVGAPLGESRLFALAKFLR